MGSAAGPRVPASQHLWGAGGRPFFQVRRGAVRSGPRASRLPLSVQPALKSRDGARGLALAVDPSPPQGYPYSCLFLPAKHSAGRVKRKTEKKQKQKKPT